MTDKTDNSDDPSSITAPKNGAQLHLVPEHEHGEPDAKPQSLSLTGFLKGLISGKSESTLHEALKEFVDEDDTTPLSSEEGHLIANILALRGLRAVDVMIPRADIVAIDCTLSNDELFSLLSEKQFSRFPVYRETLDDVIGSLHIKDVLSALARKQEVRIESLIRDVPIVSPAMPVIDLILEMKETRRHMALVVDEFGGIDGLVTVGDIIEAIVGEIEDEHEVDDEPQLTRLQDGTILADGRVDVEEFESRYGTVLTDEEREDIDTLGGLVFSIAGRVPSRGEVVSHEHSGLVLEILDADPRRVHRLRIKNIPKEQQAE
jgi:magnesium and cobalt transporter